MLPAGIAISVLLAAFYFFLFVYFTKGWKRLPDFDMASKGEQPAFSIIIPARNEEKRILLTLEDLVKQDYRGVWEIIVVDDFSEDDTAALVGQFIKNHANAPIRLIQAAAHVPTHSVKAHKKKAIEIAIQSSAYEWIVTTDADCRREAAWLSTLAAFIAEKRPTLVSMPVKMSPHPHFFHRVQALEFAGLIGIGAASIGNHSPNMCNGANLCYRKAAFLEVDGFQGVDDIASGDDELLMHKIFERWPQGVFFLKNKHALVSTLPVERLSELIQQRKRWVSKSRKYSRKQITAVLTAAYLYHLAILLTFVMTLFNGYYVWIGLFLLLVKWFSEWRFLSKITSWMGERELMKNYLPASLLYIPYVLFIGIYGNFGTYNWKGRKLR